MTTLREAAQQALEALELAKLNGGAGLYPAEIGELADAITALRAALAEQAEPDSPERRCGGPGCDMRCCQPVQEPVAWLTPGQDLHLNNPEGFRFSDWTPLYPAPPQRKPLSGEQLRQIELGLRNYYDNGKYDLSLHDFARAVEAAHGIKE